MISVLILAYNRCAETLVTLHKMSELKASFPLTMELIVIDNASTDDTSAQVKRNFPEVKLITRGRNNGVAGWNDGFQIAKYPYLLVLDDDSHIESGLLPAVEYMEAHHIVGILGFNIVDEALQGDPLLDPDEAWKHLQKIMGFIGCGALIRKSVYEKIGGFAEWLFIYTHEFDYSLRAMQAGFDTYFFETTTVVHRASKMNRTNKRLRVFGTRNEMAIIHRHFTQKQTRLLWRTWLNNFKFIKREGFMAGWYVFLGAIEFFKLRGSLKKEPVSPVVQQFYADNFWSAKPVFRSK